MGLREIAALDAKAFLEDTSASGFGWPLELISPAGGSSLLTGYATDVAESVDPETGVAVAARRASVAVSLLSLAELPVAVQDANEKPWLVRMADITGESSTFKVFEVIPDHAAGVVVLLLEAYAGTD